MKDKIWPYRMIVYVCFLIIILELILDPIERSLFSVNAHPDIMVFFLIISFLFLDISIK